MMEIDKFLDLPDEVRGRIRVECGYLVFAEKVWCFLFACVVVVGMS